MPFGISYLKKYFLRHRFGQGNTRYTTNSISKLKANLVSDNYPDTLALSLTDIATDDDSPVDAMLYSLVSNSDENAILASVADNALTDVRCWMQRTSLS